MNTEIITSTTPNNQAMEHTTNSEPNFQKSNKPAPKSEQERLSNHVQTLLTEKKAHLRKISLLEEKLKKAEEEKTHSDVNKSSETVVDIFSTAQGNAKKYLDEIKILADEEMKNSKQKASELLLKAESEAQAVKNTAREEALVIQKKAKLTLQKANTEKIAIDTLIAENTAKADSLIKQAEENASDIIRKANEEASDICNEANLKLELANTKYEQSVQRITNQTNQILSCAKLEYEHLRNLIEQSTTQYTNLCNELADFDHLLSFAETNESPLE